jgi:hypothetical protein
MNAVMLFVMGPTEEANDERLAVVVVVRLRLGFRADFARESR